MAAVKLEAAVATIYVSLKLSKVLADALDAQRLKHLKRCVHKLSLPFFKTLLKLYNRTADWRHVDCTHVHFLSTRKGRLSVLQTLVSAALLTMGQENLIIYNLLNKLDALCGRPYSLCHTIQNSPIVCAKRGLMNHH